MRYWNLTWAIPATLSIAVIWAFSAIANYDFGLTQGTAEPRDLYFFTISSAQVSGMASLAVDLLKAVLPAMIVVAWVFRQWSYVAGGMICFVLCLGFSSMNSVGFALTSHVRATDARVQAADQWTALRKALETTQKQRDLVPEHRPMTVVDADIAAKRADSRFAEAKACAEDLRGSINFCREYRALIAEKAAGDSAAALDARLDELRAQLDTRKAVSEADPMAGGAAVLFGWRKEGVAGGRSIWLAVLVETLSAVGLALIWGTFAAAWGRQKPLEASTTARVVSATEAGTIVVQPAPTRALESGAVFSSAPSVKDPNPAPIAEDEPRDPPPSGSRPDPKLPRLGELGRKHDAAKAAPEKQAPAARLAVVNGDNVKPKVKACEMSRTAVVRGEVDLGRETVLDWIGECITATHDKHQAPGSGDCHESLLAYCDREGTPPVDQQRMTQIMTEVLKPEKVGNRYPRNAKERIWPGWKVEKPAAERPRASA